MRRFFYSLTAVIRSFSVRSLRRLAAPSLKRLAVLIVLLSTVVLQLASCGGEPAPPQSLMQEFCNSYGIGRTVFSPSVPEGERGYTDSAFLDTLFGDISGCVSDYAVVFTTDLAHIGECSLLLCYSKYDALTVTEAAQRRLDMLRTTHGSLDTSALDSAFLLRRGSYVLLCALEDNTLARRLWDRLL